MSALCPSPWHDERLATAGEICQTCADGIALDAFDAVAVYEALGLLHAPGQQGLSERVSGPGGAAPSVPYDDDAGTHRTVIQRTLERWAARVINGRNLAYRRGYRLPLLECVEVIEAHVDWLAKLPDAGRCATELRECARGVPRAVANRGRRTTARIERVTRCPVVRCGAPATAYLRRESSLRAAEVRCTANPDHVWDSGHWLSLNPGAEARITTAEAAIVIWGDDSQQSRDCVYQYTRRGKLEKGDDGLFSLRQAGELARSMWVSDDQGANSG